VADGRADWSEAALDRRAALLDRREAALGRREKAAQRRQEVLRAQIWTARAEAATNARTETQLREANENLVIATVHAQTMTEVAEKTTLQMAYVAQHDFLTGLPNRVLLTDRLERAIALAARHDKKVALLYLDIDYFKRINDSLGHAVGDQLLQSVARRLQAGVRFSDTVSRQGGDEFVVLLAELDGAEGAELTARKLHQAMVPPHFVAGHRLHVTLSIGISIYPDDGADLAAIIRNADTAMYHAKKNGRNSYRAFASPLTENDPPLLVRSDPPACP
jgi:diguanylate cyclase (GGDEF)-like protein